MLNELMIPSVCSNERYLGPMPEAVQVERLAVIEIGSRASRLTVADVSMRWVRIVGSDHDLSNLFCLVEGSEISLAQKRLETTLERFLAKAAKTGAQRIRILGTEAIRLLAERSLLPPQLGIEVLSPIEEARLSFLGAAAGLGLPASDREFLVIDQGAGSMEVTDGSLSPSPHVSHSASIALGATLAEALFNRAACCIPTFKQHVSSVLHQGLAGHRWSRSRSVTVVGGIATRLGWIAVSAKRAARYSPSQVHGIQFNLECLTRVINGFHSCSASQIRSFAREFAVGSRSGPNWNEFLASSLVICEAAQRLGVEEVRVSTTGTRLGALLEMSSDGGRLGSGGLVLRSR